MTAVDDLDSFSTRMRALRGDFGSCAYCDEPFFEDEEGLKNGVHARCVVQGRCYVCHEVVFASHNFMTDTDSRAVNILYHDYCSEEAKRRIHRALDDVREAKKRRQERNEERAKRQDQEVRLLRQAQAHMVNGKHANIFVLTEKEAVDRASGQVTSEGAKLHSTRGLVHAISFDHLLGTMNFMRYDPAKLVGQYFEGMPAFVTWRVASKHEDVVPFLRARGFDPVYVEGEL